MKNGEYKEEGNTYWFKNGDLHREDGPAVVWKNGTKEWYANGKLHRENGPAIEWTAGSMEWFFIGKLHRIDGPAIIFASGAKQWYLNGQQLTELQFNQWIDMRELTKQLHFNFPEKSKQKKRI